MQKTKAAGSRDHPRSRGGRVSAAQARATTVTRLNRLSLRAARAVQAWTLGRRPAPGALVNAILRAVRPLATAERALPVTVAALVAVASMLAVLPAAPIGATGGTQGAGGDVRIAIGGGPVDAGVDPYPATGDTSSGGDQTLGQDSLAYQGSGSGLAFQPVTIPGGVTTSASSEQTSPEPGPVLDDGTLLTGYYPDTTVEDGADLLRSYKVKAGDSLVEIAHRFGVSMMTLWWANKLESKDALHVGQVLKIPPVSGVVYTVKTSDTLDAVAAHYKVDATDIVKLNGLADTTLVVGQVLVLPGAKGAPIPTPKPSPKPAPQSASRVTHTSSRTSSTQARYSGGRFQWPVIGGGNYISQYFHSGHDAVDIAASYGSKVVAAAGGRVTFAGWKSNGGGWQVWISHGGNLYTTYNHMSALTVGTGQTVSRGQQVGRIGQSGNATGPHLHFEVWIGPIWSGGTRVNPLRYF